MLQNLERREATGAPAMDPWSLALEAGLIAGELDLPPLPDVAQRVLALTSDESSSGAELAALVHRDQGLATAVLRLANSASLAGSVRIVSLQQAIARLGMSRIAEITVATCLREGLFASGAYAPVLQELWRESLATALYAREIARELRQNVETAFLCGLLRHIGRPLVLHFLEGLGASGTPTPTPEQALTLALDFDTRFGATATAEWGLPEAVGAAIEGGEPFDDASHGPAVATACFAERLARIALAESGEPVAPAVGDSAAQALNLYPETVDALLARAEEIRSEVEASVS